MAIRWAGEPSGRVGRGTSTVPACETRFIVPVRPYQAPKGSVERAENMILMGAGALALVFGFAIMVLSAM